MNKLYISVYLINRMYFKKMLKAFLFSLLFFFSGHNGFSQGPLIAYTPLSNTCTKGSRDLIATITDADGVPTSGLGLPVLYWKINSEGSYYSSTGVSLGSGQYRFSFGAIADTGTVVYYYIAAQDNLLNVSVFPSGGESGPSVNPPAVAFPPASLSYYVIQRSIASGSYLVGASQPAPFNTLVNAVNAYNTSCSLNGPITFLLTDANYILADTTININAHPLASATNTLTIKPNAGVVSTITGSSEAIFKFLGADYIIIDGSNAGTSTRNLTIKNTSTSLTSTVIWLSSFSSGNGSTNNVIKNCNIAGNSSTTTFSCIALSSSSIVNTSAEFPNSRNTIQNNNIYTAYQGIYLNGNDAGDDLNVVSGNIVGSATIASKIGYRALSIINQNNVTINSNSILGVSSSVLNNGEIDASAGVYVGGSINGGNIYANTIRDIVNTNASAAPSHGISLQSITDATGMKVYNNFIYAISAYGSATNVANNGYGIAIVLGGGYGIYFNSIHLTTNQTVAGYSASMYIGSSASSGSIDMRNNIFSNRQTTGIAYSIYCNVSNSVFSAINYNDYYGYRKLGFINAADKLDLGDWQLSTGSDGNSVAVNPLFVSVTDLHLQDISPLNNQGIAISGITTDIDGATRTNPPDIGADDFAPPPCSNSFGGTAAVVSSTVFCVSGSPELSCVSFSSGGGMLYQWESSSDNISWSSIAGETNPTYANPTAITVNTFFRLKAVCNNGTPGYSNVVQVQVKNPQITSTTPGSRCGNGTLDLSATGNTETTVQWYSASSGGAPLSTGNNFTTPVISNTTTYYAEPAFIGTGGSCGPVSPYTLGGSVNVQQTPWKVYFNILQATTIVSVDIFPYLSGESFSLDVRNSANQTIWSIPFVTTVAGGTTAQTIPLNAFLLPGNQYSLVVNTGASGGLPNQIGAYGFARNNSGAVYPYTSSDIEITGNEFSPSYFQCFYNWKFTTGCVLGRTPIVATVNQPTSVSVSALSTTVCVKDSTTLIASSTNTNYTYVWMPGNLTGASVKVAPEQTTTYTLTATAGLCVANGTISVKVLPRPDSLIISPRAVTRCYGTVQQITTSGATLNNVTIFSENFNDDTRVIPSGWDTINVSATAGKWTARPNNYVFSDLYGNYFTFRSNDSSRFFLANSDAQSASYTTSLKTPLISLVGYSSAKLYFWHNYTTYDGTDAIYIDKSVPTANTTWSSTPLFSRVNSPVNIGASNRFVLDSVDLTPFINTSFYIRFRYLGSQDFFWAIDNIEIKGTAAPQITWSPVAGLYTTSAGTVAYAGSATPTVWANPTATTSYIATAGTTVNACIRRDSSVFNIYPLISATFSPNTTICAGDTTNLSLTLTGTGPWTFTLRRLMNSVTKDTTITTSSSTYIIPVTPTATAIYSLLGFTDYNTCTTTVTLKDTITVLAKATAAVISKASVTSICNNNVGTNIKVTITNGTGPFTLVYTALRRGASAPDTVTISGYISATNINVFPTDTTLYTVLSVTGANGCTFYSASSVTVNVVQMPVPGTISPSSVNVCLPTNTTLMTLTGYSPSTGVSYQWKKSIDGGVTWTTIATLGTGVTYTANNIATTTYYHVVITNQGLCKDTSAFSVINYISGVSAGTISGNGTVCTGTNSTTLTLNGYNGNIQWQSSLNNITFTNITGATSSTYTVNNLTATTYYRAFVTSASCGNATSSSVAITVSPLSVAGNISGSTTVCSGTNSTLLTLNGSTGNIQWQSSSDNITFTDIAGQTASTYTAANLTQSTYYRAVVTSGVCASSTTTSVLMTVNPQAIAGNIAGATIVCSGTNSTLLTLNGTVGSVQWQSSTDNTTYTNISGQTSTSYTAVNLTQSTYYRVLVSSGVCASVTTTSVLMTVNPQAVAGTITGNQFVCSNPNSTTLTLNGTVGSIQWQSSTDNTTFTNIDGQTSSTYIASNINATTYYQAVLTSGICGSATTNVFTLSMASKPTGVISGSDIICSGSSASLTINFTGVGPWNGSLSDGTLFSGNTNPLLVSVNPPAGVTTAYTISTLNDSRCNATSSELTGTALIRVIGNSSITDTSYWFGKASNQWNDAANWCGGIPSLNKSVVIPDGLSFYPIITDTNSVTRSLLINSGGSVTVNSGAKIKIHGDLINNGNFINNGSLSFAGNASMQNFTVMPGGNINSTMDTLEISKESGLVNINNRVRISGSLRLNSGIMNLYDTIVMLSTLSSTANIESVGNNFSINYSGPKGCFSVERFIPAGISHGKSWQLLSAPTSGQTVSESWQEGAAGISSNPKPGYGTTISSNISNATSLGFDLQSFSPSMKVYNDVTNTYDGIPNTNSLSIANVKGYMIFVRGDRTVTTSTQAATPLTLRTTGRIYYPNNPPSSVSVLPGKFQSVGNPYASSIDFLKLQETSSGIVNFYYVWDPLSQVSNGLGAFQTISPQFGAVPGGTSYYPSGVPYSTIQSGQAFFVRSNTGGTVNFSESAKTKESRLIFRTQQTTDPATLRLFLKNPDNSIADGNLLAVDSIYSNDFDENDAVKFSNVGENVAIKDNNQILSIDTRLSINENDTVWYYLSNLRSQRYRLYFEPRNFSALNLQAVLYDKYVGNSYRLSLADSSSYYIDVTADVASRVPDRFFVVFKPLQTLPVNFVSVRAIRQNETNHIEWEVSNEIQVTQYEIEKSADGIHFESVGEKSPSFASSYSFDDLFAFEGDNFYRIRCVSLNGESQFSDVVKISVLNKQSSITISPNPVFDHNVNLHFTNVKSGSYQIKLYGTDGKMILFQEINHDRSKRQYIIHVNDLIPSGIYLLKITNRSGNQWYQKLIFQ